MTARDLLQMLQSQIDRESQFVENEIQMTPVHDYGKKCVSHVMAPIENKTKLLKVTIEELCIYDGLETHEHLVP
jgi:hypothetical protein